MQVFKPETGGLVKAWVDGVEFEDAAKKQVFNIASMPFIYKHIAVMPDCHAGKGSTVGTVIATKNAIIPASIGVDNGCGVIAARTNLKASDLPDNLQSLRFAIERAIPHGRTDSGGPNDRGAWNSIPTEVQVAWMGLENRFNKIVSKHPKIGETNNITHLGTLGGGNHSGDVTIDNNQNVWVLVHSGSRGVGGKIGSYFIELAKKDMRKWFINLPDEDLAYFPEGTDHFDDYFEAISWAQDYAMINRELMVDAMVKAIASTLAHNTVIVEETVRCHHNYAVKEHHFGENVYITRKGAVCARPGMPGVILGSMATPSYVVSGKGNPESFHTCSHGAGRKMSRNEAKKVFTVEDHEEFTKNVECRKDSSIIDETPGVYKNIHKIMEAQKDLVDIVYELNPVVCIKG